MTIYSLLINNKQKDRIMNKDQIKKDIADMIIKAMEENGSNFMQSWVDSGMPRNGHGRYYSSINLFSLWIAKKVGNHNSNVWLTFKQINKLGGMVNKGEHGTYVVGWFTYEKDRVAQRGAKKGQTVTDTGVAPRWYKVFNIDQTNLDEAKLKLPKQAHAISDVDEYVANTNADIRIDNGADGCSYHPLFDRINMQHKDKFFAIDGSTATENYYATLLHELTHWTGHRTRNNRIGITLEDIDLRDHKLRAELYAYEELVAEIGSAIQCCILGVSSGVKKSSAKYLNGWKKSIKDNPDVIFKACSDAQKGVNFIEKLQVEATKQVKKVA